MSKDGKTDWSNTFILIVWTVFWGNIFVSLFHPMLGLLKEYIWVLPILSFAGLICGIILIIFIICGYWDKYKKEKEELK